jgi:hypothetical protein
MLTNTSTSPIRRGATSGIPPNATLAEHHSRYLQDRGVDAREAHQTFWTARKRSEIPEAFSEYQRRGTPALIAAFPSPDRQTVGYQMYSDYPRKDRDGKTVKWMSPPSKRARMVLGVHPGMVEGVRTGARPLWLVEGITRAAALAPFGIDAVAFAGCFGWQRHGEPLECWRYVNLRGRLVLVAPDADYRTNSNVYKALRGLVAFLEGQGARVLVVDVPQINGDANTGLDDWIAANGHPAPLERNAQPLADVDVGRERLKRDERLRIFVAAKRREAGELPTRKTAECNAAKVARFMVETSATAHGKPRERGVEVHPSFPQIAEGVRFGSFQTVRKALDRLQDIGFLERIRTPRKRREAASYLLLYPWGGGSEKGVNMREPGGAGWESQEYKEEGKTSLSQRESSPCLHSTRGGADQPTNVPALRNSKLIHTYAIQGGRRVVVHSDYFRRYGSKREEIARYVIGADGVDEKELWQKFGSKKSRERDFRRTWIKPMLDDGVFVRDGGRILPATDWLEALQRVRERTGEDEDNRRQSEKYAERRRRYLQAKDTPTERVPHLSGKEKNLQTFHNMEERDEAARIEQQRSRVGETVEVFVHDKLMELGKIRMGLLRELWADKGGDPSHVWFSVRRLRCKLERLPEHDNSLFVYPPAATKPEPEPAPPPELAIPLPQEEAQRERPPRDRGSLATVTPIHPTLPPATYTAPSSIDDAWRTHSLTCECDGCMYPESKYARPYAGSGVGR